MDKTVDKASALAQGVLGKLQAMVEEFEAGEAEVVRGLAGRAQLIVNTLPFSSKMPQLMQVNPRFVVVRKDKAMTRLHFEGNFPWSAKRGFEPSLMLGDMPCPYSSSTTTRLVFDMPVASFLDRPGQSFSCAKGKLTVPWDSGWMRSHREEWDYHVEIGALPLMAGLVRVNYGSMETKKEEEVTKHFFSYNGNMWYEKGHPDRWHTVTQLLTPRKGWEIETSRPPTIDYDTGDCTQGQHEEGFRGLSPESVVFETKLFVGRGHGMGHVQGRVLLPETRTVSHEMTRQEEFELRWGDLKLLKPNDGERVSSVEFHCFDGTVQKFGTPSLRHGVLKSQFDQDGRWEIWATPPTAL